MFPVINTSASPVKATSANGWSLVANVRELTWESRVWHRQARRHYEAEYGFDLLGVEAKLRPCEDLAVLIENPLVVEDGQAAPIGASGGVTSEPQRSPL